MFPWRLVRDKPIYDLVFTDYSFIGSLLRDYVPAPRLGHIRDIKNPDAALRRPDLAESYLTDVYGLFSPSSAGGATPPTGPNDWFLEPVRVLGGISNGLASKTQFSEWMRSRIEEHKGWTGPQGPARKAYQPADNHFFDVRRMTDEEADRIARDVRSKCMGER